MKASINYALVCAVALGCFFGPRASGPAHAEDKIKIGFVFFLSGPGAAYGIHARDGAKLIVDALNAGKVPAPYNKVGMNGIQIDPIYLDEAGGAQKQLAQYRRLVESDQVDMVIGYNSSGDCNAIAPVAEEMKVLTDFFHCGNPQLFEEIITKPEYSVRTAPTGTMDQVAAVKYMLAKMPSVTKVAGINQDHAWGQDSWAEFKATMLAMKPDIRFTNEIFTKLGTADYGAEISSLLSKPADVVFSSFWGADADAFAMQSKTRGLPEKSRFLLTMGTEMIDDLGDKSIAGSMFGARGPHAYFTKKIPLSDWFIAEYRRAYNKFPLRGLTFDTASGFPVTMALNNGHQAIQATAYGTFAGWDKDANAPIVSDVTVYPATCVNPPDGVRAIDWIKSGFKGASC